MTDPTAPPRHGARHLARIVLSAFLLTFVLSRIVVLLIMSRVLPDLYLHMGGTHVHHLNYGIFLLVGVGAWMLFAPPPGGRLLSVCATAYGIGLALTFDEFGMWLHLGGDYWQRASFDAVTVIAAILALIAFSPAPRDWKPRHFAAAAVMLAVTALFGAMLVHSLQKHDVGSRLRHLEDEAPQ